MSFAVLSGFTLKPMMMALEALASVTSDSLMLPTPPWMQWIAISSFESLRSDCFTASTEPATSALTMMFRSFIAPAATASDRLSSESFCFVSAMSFSLLCAIYASEMFFASSLFSVAIITSPAFGTLFKPRISTGVEGVASVTFSPLALIIARILPKDAPMATVSPTCSVPF